MYVFGYKIEAWCIGCWSNHADDDDDDDHFDIWMNHRIFALYSCNYFEEFEEKKKSKMELTMKKQYMNQRMRILAIMHMAEIERGKK